MRKRHYSFYYLLFFSLLMISSNVFAQKKVACIGNSITEGWGLPTGAKSYPAILQDLLGKTDFEVKNYGVSAHSMLRKSDIPYWNTSQYKQALEWKPDVVIIKLGTNDSKPVNWDKYKGEFKSDYIDFINSFKTLDSNPTIYVCYPIPIFPATNHAGPKGDAVIKDEMMPILTEIATETGASIIDLHTPFEDKVFLSDDGLHPNKNGTIYLASLVAKAVCPSCEIDELPENLLTKVEFHNRAALNVNTISSVEGLDITPLIDNDASTVLSVTFESDMYLGFELQDASTVTAYSLTAGDSQNSNISPRSWKFQGKKEGVENWEVLHAQSEMEFLPNETKYYLLDSKGESYTSFRLVIKENNGNEVVKLNEWQVFGTIASRITANGGTITARTLGVNNEVVENLIDNNVGTKYCASYQSSNFWIQYASAVPVRLKEYILTSANDAPERDPVAWTLEGSEDGKTWEILDTQSNQEFSGRFSTLIYPVTTTKDYLYFRLNITKIKSGSLFQLSEWGLFGEEGSRIKVACVGNSITEGGYPSDLQDYLGVLKFDVRNFGASGRTLLKEGKEFDGNASSYWDHERYQKTLDFQPDIVVIKLGTNDAKAINWNSLKGQFKNDYIELINSFKALESQPDIYVCYPIPLYGPNNWINDDKVLTGEMIPIIQEVIEETGVNLIDLHTPFDGKFYFVDDLVHPNQKGRLYLAHLVANAICSECEIADLPEDLFNYIADADRSDKLINKNSSVDKADLSSLFDNDGTTVTELPFSANMWVSVEFSAATKATAYTLTSGTSTECAPAAWTFEGSIDGTTWTKIDQQKDIAFLPGETKVFNNYMSSYTALKGYTYFRVVFSENNGGDKLSIGEWQIFGSKVSFSESLMNNNGTITAQYNTLPHEGPTNLIDRSVESKYCTGTEGNSWWIRYDSPDDLKINGYALTSANDAPDRDPISWILYGSVNGRSWQELDRRENQKFVGRYSTLEYPVVTENAYQYYRLTITKKNSGNMLQFAEWELFGTTMPTNISVTETSGITLFTDKGKLWISSDASSCKYEVYSVTGQSLLTGEVEPGGTVSETINFGVYLVALKSFSGNMVKKIIIR